MVIFLGVKLEKVNTILILFEGIHIAIFLDQVVEQKKKVVAIQYSLNLTVHVILIAWSFSLR
jgi:hypothetical protein